MKTQSKKKKPRAKNLPARKNLNTVQDFDPVKMMRDIRKELAQEIAGMTYEEEIAYLEKLIAKG